MELTCQVIYSNLSVNVNYYSLLLLLLLLFYCTDSISAPSFQNKIILISERCSTSRKSIESHKKLTAIHFPCMVENRHFRTHQLSHRRSSLEEQPGLLCPSSKSRLYPSPNCEFDRLSTSPSLISSSIGQGQYINPNILYR